MMDYEHFCPDCGRRFSSPCRATHCCEPCAERRRARVRELDARYPSSEQLGLNPIGSGPYVVPYERAVRPHSSGRRVIRKAEPLGG